MTKHTSAWTRERAATANVDADSFRWLGTGHRRPRAYPWLVFHLVVSAHQALAHTRQVELWPVQPYREGSAKTAGLSIRDDCW